MSSGAPRPMRSTACARSAAAATTTSRVRSTTTSSSNASGAVLRRVQPPEPGVIVAGPLLIEPHARTVRIGGAPVPLSQKEFALLVRLGSDPKRVFTKEELLRDIWGYQAQVRTRTLDSHVSRLRRKFRAIDPVTPLIENEWGVGDRLLHQWLDVNQASLSPSSLATCPRRRCFASFTGHPRFLSCQTRGMSRARGPSRRCPGAGRSRPRVPR